MYIPMAAVPTFFWLKSYFRELLLRWLTQDDLPIQNVLPEGLKMSLSHSIWKWFCRCSGSLKCNWLLNKALHWRFAYFRSHEASWQILLDVNWHLFHILTTRTPYGWAESLRDLYLCIFYLRLLWVKLFVENSRLTSLQSWCCKLVELPEKSRK